jgi:Tol biopolymer transport system component
MDSPSANKIRELIQQADAAFERGDRKTAGILVNQVFELDYNHPSAWLLVQKLMGNTQPLETFQIEFTKRFYPAKLHLLQKPVVKAALPDWLNTPPTRQPTLVPVVQAVKPITQPVRPRPEVTPPPQKPARKRSPWLVSVLLLLALILAICLLSNTTLLILPSLRRFLVFYGYSSNVAMVGIAASVLGLGLLMGAWARKKWATYALIATLVLSPLLFGGLMLVNSIGGNINLPGTGTGDNGQIIPILQDPGHIVFISDRLSTPSAEPDPQSSPLNLCIMNPDGSDQTCLTNIGNDGMVVFPSPDGNKIAFVSSRAGEKTSDDLYVINLDGSGLFQLTNTGNIGLDYYSLQSWSPDSSKIVFRSYSEGDVSSDIYTINIDGTGLTRLTYDAMSASFSPDGKKILFLSWRDGAQDAYVMNTDGSGITRLTYSGAWLPSWSPDGTKIAYWGSTDNLDSMHIYVMNADGSNAVPVVEVFTDVEWYSWSPDGTKIVYNDLEPNESENPLHYVYVVGIEGGERIPLAMGAYPVFSPDGKWIAYRSYDFTSDGNIEPFGLFYQISTIKLDGSNQIQLTRDSNNVLPIWIP